VTWTAGTRHLNGTQALLYVRDRYGLASGAEPVTMTKILTLPREATCRLG